MVNMKLKPLTKSYLELLRLWRNQNRKFFLSQKLITKKAQQKWYKTYKANPNDKIYIVFYQNIPVGSIGTTISKNRVEIGRVMLGEKKWERRGIMGEALEKVISWFKNKKIFLRVLCENQRAISFYKKHGFKVMAKEKNYYLMERSS